MDPALPKRHPRLGIGVVGVGVVGIVLVVLLGWVRLSGDDPATTSQQERVGTEDRAANARSEKAAEGARPANGPIHADPCQRPGEGIDNDFLRPIPSGAPGALIRAQAERTRDQMAAVTVPAPHREAWQEVERYYRQVQTIATSKGRSGELTAAQHAEIDRLTHELYFRHTPQLVAMLHREC